MRVTENLRKDLSNTDEIPPIPKSYKSGAELFHRDPLQSFQLSQIVPTDQPDYDTVGRPIPHLSAFEQATGEAIYTDDLPMFEDELRLAFVLSTKAHAKILSIDASLALQECGVFGFLCAKVIGVNYCLMAPVVYKNGANSK